MYKKRIYIILIIILILFVSLSLALEIVNSRTFQFFGEIVHQIETEEKVVALTFDDGPTDKTTEILTLLDELEIKATFFVTGAELEENLHEGKRIVNDGHELGNHSYSHNRMIFKRPQTIKITDLLIRKTGYEGEIYFRPPNGKKLLILPYYLSSNNRTTIMWNIEPDSYAEIASSSKNIANYVENNIEPGSIILLHVMYDSREESLNSIKDIVEILQNEGYKFVTISELLDSY